MISHRQKPGDRHQNQVSKSFQIKVTNLAFFSPLYLILIDRNDQKMAIWPLWSIWGVWQWSQWISHVPKPGDRHQNQVYTIFQTKVTNLAIFSPQYLILIGQNGHKRPFSPLRSIWWVWQWSQWISHVPKPGDRHQNQVSRTFQTKVTNLAIFGYIWFSVPKWNRRARIENIVVSW